MRKKVFIILFILIFVLALGASSFVAAAEENLDEMPLGEDLGDFDVKIGYKNYTLYSSGAYRAIEITFDKSFIEEKYPKIGESERDYSFLDSFSADLTSLGYEIRLDQENNKIIGERTFESLTDLYIAMGIDGYETDNTKYETQKSFLYVDTFIKQNSPFVGIEEAESGFKNILEAIYKLDIKRGAVLLNYTYGTPYKIIKSDADNQFYLSAENIYLHSYDMNLDMTGRKINLVQHSPNAIGWYSIAIIIALVVISVPLSVLIIKHKKKNKETYYGR